LALWDEAGVQMPPGHPARGVDVLREAVPAGMAGETVASFDIRPEETVVAGDWAWSRGTYDLKGEAKGEPYHVDGKFLTILERQADGSWKIYRDAFNSNVP
jgi:ketosteroid isomerase-like protein